MLFIMKKAVYQQEEAVEETIAPNDTAVSKELF